VGIGYSDFRVALDNRREAFGGVGRRLQRAALDDECALDQRESAARGDACGKGLLAVGSDVQDREMRHIEVTTRRWLVEDALADGDREDRLLVGGAVGGVAGGLAARLKIGARQWPWFGGWFEAFGASGFIGVGVFGRHG